MSEAEVATTPTPEENAPTEPPAVSEDLSATATTEMAASTTMMYAPMDPSNPQYTTQILDCPQGLVGRLIGRGGETIKDMQDRSGANIQIDQNVPEGQPRKVTVSGTVQAVQMGVSVVQEVMKNGPPRHRAGEFAAMPGMVAPGMVAPVMPGAMAMGGAETTVGIDCPQGLVGRIIGRGGETIKDLQDRSGTNIQIDQNFPDGHPRKVTISGPAHAVPVGVSMVEEVMRNGPPRRPAGPVAAYGQAPAGYGGAYAGGAYMQAGYPQQTYGAYGQQQYMQAYYGYAQMGYGADPNQAQPTPEQQEEWRKQWAAYYAQHGMYGQQPAQPAPTNGTTAATPQQ